MIDLKHVSARIGKTVSTAFAAFVLAMGTGAPSVAFAAANEIVLPAPQTSGGMPLMEALDQRKSERHYADLPLTEAQLSNILWAANGINRSAGDPSQAKRVNPAALGVYSVDVYAVTPDGIYLYEPNGHTLNLVAEGDYRGATTSGQSFVKTAYLSLVYVEYPTAWQTASRFPDEESRLAFATISAGAMAQSVGLVAASEGLGNCVRASVDRDAFRAAADLPSDRHILFAQTVGVPES